MMQQVFPGTLDSLAPIREFVGRAAAAAGLDKSAAYNLCLAVDEIATNIVIHGYQATGRQGDLRLDAETEPGRLVVSVADTGPAYDPSKHEVPDQDDLQSPLHERSAGGLGIMLAMQGVDDLEYSTSERGNVHRFIVNLPQQKQAAR